MADAPVAADVIEALQDAGFVAPDDSTVDDALASAIAEFEKRTGWLPFLAEEEDSEFHIDPPRTPMEPATLPFGVVSITAVAVNVTPYNTTGTVLASEQWQGLDYNGPGELRPINRIRLLDGTSFDGYNYRSVKVTAKKGAVEAWPIDAKKAVVGYAARLVVATQQGGGNVLSEIKQGPVTMKFEKNDSSEGGGSSWESYFMKTCAIYAGWTVA